jgi:peptidoglycan/LPS O-acetylase OafA/YrhL
MSHVLSDPPRSSANVTARNARESPPPQIPALTGLRFVAALTVLVAHATDNLAHFAGEEPIWRNYLSAVSGLGMPLFFVLSGFVIHYNYSRQIFEGNGRGFYNFLVARFARLYPMFLLVFIYDLYLYNYAYHLNTGDLAANELYRAAPYYLLLMQSWFYVTIGKATLISAPPAMIQVTWSVSTEWFFYLVYPVVCLLIARIRTGRAILLVFLALVIIGYAALYIASRELGVLEKFAVARMGEVASRNLHPNDSFVTWFFYFSPYPRVLEFVLGSLAAALVLAMRTVPVSEHERRWGTAATWLSVGGLGTILAVLYAPSVVATGSQLGLLLRMVFGFAPPVAVLLFCCARYQTPVSAILSSTRMVVCGEASYSMYLLHMGIIQYAAIWNFMAKLPTPIPDVEGAITVIIRLLIVVLVTIGLSLVTYNLVEVPWRRWLRRWLSINPTAGG